MWRVGMRSKTVVRDSHIVVRDSFLLFYGTHIIGVSNVVRGYAGRDVVANGTPLFETHV